MKLLFINYHVLPLPPVKGGAVENLIDLFIKDNEKKNLHDITVISVYDEKAEVEARKYNYCSFMYVRLKAPYDKLRQAVRHVINSIPRIYIGNLYIRKVRKLLVKSSKTADYDAIIVENTPEFGLILRKIYKGRLILHLHNDYLNEHTKLAKKVLDSFDSVFSISDFIGERVKTIYKNNKTHTLYNGLDIERFDKTLFDAAAVREQYGIEENDVVIMYSGRLVPEKGVRELIQAFLQNTESEKYKLVIMGSAKYGSTVQDDYYMSLKRLIRDHENRVVFTGYVSYEDVPKVYSIADIGIVPSLCDEGFCLVIVEFMLQGIPVIASDKGAIKELVDKNCGIMISCDSNFVNNISKSIVFLTNNPDTAKALGNVAEKKAKLFDKKIYCNRFNLLLNESIGETINECIYNK